MPGAPRAASLVVRIDLVRRPYFHELELPTLRLVRSIELANPINILGQGRVVVVAPDGKQVYIETWRQTGPTRFDPSLEVGQPDGDYGIAIYDVAQGAVIREITLDAPWWPGRSIRAPGRQARCAVQDSRGGSNRRPSRGKAGGEPCWRLRRRGGGQC